MSEKSSQKPPLKEQLSALDDIVAWFDSGEFDLDDAQIKFEQGLKLASTIKKRLAAVENKIEVLKKQFSEQD